jgi:SNF family Na+-dependent transporter
MFLGIGSLLGIVAFVNPKYANKKKEIWVGILVAIMGVSFAISDLDTSDKYVKILFPLFALATILLVLTILYDDIKRIILYFKSKNR